MVTRTTSLVMATALLRGQAAYGQTQTSPAYRLVCNAVGQAGTEPVAGKEGMRVEHSNQSCVQEGGTLDGAIYTGTTVWEYAGSSAKVLTGLSSTRFPGSLVVTQLTDGSMDQKIENGRVVGFSGSCKSIYVHASGPASALAGKGYTCTFKSTTQRRFVMDIQPA